MKTWEEIGAKIEAKKAVVLTADEIMDYVERKGLDEAAREVDVVTTATFGPMCSSGCFLNFGHTRPRMRMTEAWIDDVLAYSGIAAVDLYLGATELRHHDPANMDYPGEFRYGGGHVIERLVAGERLQLFALSYGTDDYPKKELRTWFTLADLNQAVMVNPRNCYQNYNVATNLSERTIHTYLGVLKPGMKNLGYSSAGQLSPLLNDPFYRTIGVGTSVWLAGARGHVFAEGTQHSPVCERGANGVPSEGAGTLALTGDMKRMRREFVRGVSLIGYGVSLALGVAIPIPILDREVLRNTCVRDSDILAPVVDYSDEYPNRGGRSICQLSYEELKRGEVVIRGKKVETGSLSSYAMALEAANLLADEIRRGEFVVTKPIRPLAQDVRFHGLEPRGPDGRPVERRTTKRHEA